MNKKYFDAQDEVFKIRGRLELGEALERVLGRTEVRRGAIGQTLTGDLSRPIAVDGPSGLSPPTPPATSCFGGEDLV